YRAEDLSLLYDSNVRTGDALSSSVEFAVPTIADGKVFAPNAYGVTVYGELPPPASPSITAVTNAASYADDAISPGSLISIFGSGLAPLTASASAVPLPLSIADTSVTINGLAAPILFVSPHQINVQAPYEISPGKAALAVRSHGAQSSAATV